MNMSGRWKLNLKKSRYGKQPKPKKAMYEMVHKEPALKYSFTETGEKGQAIKIEFDGAIDGKPYKCTGPQGGNTLTLKRINDSTNEGTETSADGKTTTTFTEVISRDGKVLTLDIALKGPEGEDKQTLVYEKQ